MVRFLYLIIRFFEVTLTVVAALAMVFFSSGMSIVLFGDGDLDVVKLAPVAFALITVFFGFWLIRRRFRISGRDELFGQTGVDLSEGGSVMAVLIVVGLFVGGAIWWFGDEVRFPKQIQSESNVHSP